MEHHSISIVLRKQLPKPVDTHKIKRRKGISISADRVINAYLAHMKSMS